MRGDRTEPIVRVVEAVTHGRFLVQPPAGGTPRGLLVGFHGYAETASVMLERLVAIPGSGEWLLASIQGLHRFYRGSAQDLAASWMTREDRDLAIRDNAAYVTGIVTTLLVERPACSLLGFVGFSQGVAMAFRAACGMARPVDAVIALGGDVPPELAPDALARVAHALHGRGDHDPWYLAEQFAADQVRLREAHVDLTTYCFDADHAWTSVFSEAAGHFLHRLGPRAVEIGNRPCTHVC
jgi:predicted esterase